MLFLLTTTTPEIRGIQLLFCPIQLLFSVWGLTSGVRLSVKIDAAISHAETLGREKTDCGREHRQLARWLKELKRLREENRLLKRFVAVKSKGDL